MLSYRSARRRLAGLINEHLAPRFGWRIVRSWPRNIAYRMLPSTGDLSRASVRAGGRSVDVMLRRGTSDWMTFEQIFIDEDYDLRPLPRFGEVQRAYDTIKRNGKQPLIVDLGANIGLSTLYFDLVWPGCRIVAVEPDAENYALLERNVRGRDTILPVRAGAASKSGRLRIVDPHAEKNAVRTTSVAADQRDSIPAIHMAEILRLAGDGVLPFLVKIDIEGGESDLFAADVDWIDQFPLIVIELHDWLYPGQRTSQNFLRAIAERDRDFMYLDENVFSIRNPMMGI